MVSLIVAVIFIVFGSLLMKYPPKDINSIYGYRTTLSMINQDTWDVSQRQGGISMLVLGVSNCILGCWSTIQPMAINNETVQLVFLLIGATVMIVIDEIQLRKLFNRDGSRKR